MSSKTSKRSNQDAESEPAAKRKAVANPEKEEKTAEVSSNHLESIAAAQEAFDRLDFKSAQEICSQIIDADSSNAKALILRSMSRERTGQLRESVEDAEAAVKVKGKKDLKTYIRGAFAHLAMAKHLLQLAVEIESEDESANQKDEVDSAINGPDQTIRDEIQVETHSQEEVIMENGTEPKKKIEQKEEIQESWLQELNLEELIGGITTMQVKEVRSPFRRIDSELFVHIVYFCDSPTIVRSMGVSKSWKSLIIGSSNLFREFEMEGEMDQIIKGIDSFRSRCKDSIQAIDLKVKGIPTNKEIRRLREAMKPSSQSLRDLWIDLNPNLCQLMLEIAAEAPLLSILSSSHEETSKPSLAPVSTLPKMPAAWRPRLRKFYWLSGESLEVGPVLLSALQGAKDVRIASRGVRASWVLDLLSSAPSLETLWIFYMSPDTEEVEIVPLMKLPTLSSLYLVYAPKSTSTHDSSVFFQNLKAPNLFHLMLEQSNLKELGFLSPDSSPAQLSITGLEDSCSDAEAAEAAASALVSSISKWDKLTRLSLKLDSSSAAFWNRLLWLITPMSRENVQAGYRDRLLLPRLKSMVLGRQNSECEAAIPGTVLASLIASRKSLNRGLCSNDVLFAAMGDLQASSSAPPTSREETLFKDFPKCAQIQEVEVNVPITMDGAIESWLKEAVKFKCSTLLGM